MMIIGGTINIGGYGTKHKFVSNEFDTPEECIEDIRVSLLLVREPRITDYVKRNFG